MYHPGHAPECSTKEEGGLVSTTGEILCLTPMQSSTLPSMQGVPGSKTVPGSGTLKALPSQRTKPYSHLLCFLIQSKLSFVWMNYFTIVYQLLQLRFLFHITALTVNREGRGASNSHKPRDWGSSGSSLSWVGAQTSGKLHKYVIPLLTALYMSPAAGSRMELGILTGQRHLFHPEKDESLSKKGLNFTPLTGHFQQLQRQFSVCFCESHPEVP